MSVSIAFNNNQCFGRKSVCLIEFIIWLSTVVGRTLWRRWVPGYRWLMYVLGLHGNRLSIGIVVITSAALYHPPCRCTDFVKIRSTLIPQFHSQSSSPPNMRRTRLSTVRRPSFPSHRCPCLERTTAQRHLCAVLSRIKRGRCGRPPPIGSEFISRTPFSVQKAHSLLCAFAIND